MSCCEASALSLPALCGPHKVFARNSWCANFPNNKGNGKDCLFSTGSDVLTVFMHVDANS